VIDILLPKGRTLHNYRDNGGKRQVVVTGTDRGKKKHPPGKNEKVH
jgi:hypothetical protein